MRQYKSVALLHIFCIQLQFRYLPWNHSPAYISAASYAHTGHELKREILCMTFVVLIGKRKKRFGILSLRKHWHRAQKHAFQLCECFCPELFNFKIGLRDLNIRTHHVGNSKTIWIGPWPNRDLVLRLGAGERQWERTCFAERLLMMKQSKKIYKYYKLNF